MSSTEKQFERSVKKAIKVLDAAWAALGEITDDRAQRDDSRVRLRTDIREYLEYLEHAKWWRA